MALGQIVKIIGKILNSYGLLKGVKVAQKLGFKNKQIKKAATKLGFKRKNKPTFQDRKFDRTFDRLEREYDRREFFAPTRSMEKKAHEEYLAYMKNLEK